MDIYYISPRDVIIGRNWSDRDVIYQKSRLAREGQIEPIVVKPPQNGQYELNEDHPDFWAYSGALVKAAKSLGWDEILVTY